MSVTMIEDSDQGETTEISNKNRNKYSKINQDYSVFGCVQKEAIFQENDQVGALGTRF